MPPVNCPVLAFVVRAYDAGERPVTPPPAVAALGLDRTTVRDRFETLHDCELVAQVDGGYRPTVTGRELLELDGAVLVDPDGGCRPDE